jgi:hypothetical protein
MEIYYGREDFNGMRVILEKFVELQSLSGSPCLQELKLMLTIQEIRHKLNLPLLLMK